MATKKKAAGRKNPVSNIKEEDLGDVVAIGIGLCAASACARVGVSKKRIENYMNREHPTGISSKWTMSEDKNFHSGETNPCACNEFPRKRKHYLLNC